MYDYVSFPSSQLELATRRDIPSSSLFRIEFVKSSLMDICGTKVRMNGRSSEGPNTGSFDSPVYRILGSGQVVIDVRDTQMMLS